MFLKFKIWLIKKLGGVPYTLPVNSITIKREYEIIPCKTRINLPAFRGDENEVLEAARRIGTEQLANFIYKNKLFTERIIDDPGETYGNIVVEFSLKIARGAWE